MPQGIRHFQPQWVTFIAHCPEPVAPDHDKQCVYRAQGLLDRLTELGSVRDVRFPVDVSRPKCSASPA
jgi:hypothetical protein